MAVFHIYYLTFFFPGELRMATMGKMHVIQGVGKIKNLNKSCFTYSVHLFDFLNFIHPLNSVHFIPRSHSSLTWKRKLMVKE